MFSSIVRYLDDDKKKNTMGSLYDTGCIYLQVLMHVCILFSSYFNRRLQLLKGTYNSWTQELNAYNEIRFQHIIVWIYI